MDRINLKIIIIVLVVLVPLGALGFWFYSELTKPLPGVAIEDLGRQHVPIGTETEYNSNPPTSGSHYEDWIRAGVYEDSKDDRYLIHSLEHGYVIISYYCGESINLEASASGSQNKFLPREATSSALLPEYFQSQECKELVSKLTQVYEDKGKTKLIVVPRPNLDTKIALTAWGRIEKLDSFDAGKIKHFIDVLRDHGPERTME